MSLPAIENLRQNGLPEGSDMGNGLNEMQGASTPHLHEAQKAPKD